MIHSIFLVLSLVMLGGHCHRYHHKHYPPKMMNLPVPPAGAKKCPAGFNWFTRGGDRQYITNGLKPEDVCSSVGAQIYGLETQIERDFLYDVARADLNMRGVKEGGAWIGAQRNMSCLNCPVDQQFIWTDGVTVGREPLSPKYWQKYQPNDSQWFSANGERCVTMYIRSYVEADNGLYDDVPCELKGLPSYGEKYGPMGVFGTVCGVLAA